jgi:hypothetical protein
VERRSGGLGRGWPPGRRWRWARVPAVAAGLLLTERALVGAVGAPVAQVRALRSLGQGPVDPVAPLLAALALLTEALVGYVLVVLILRSLCALPESVGRLAGRAALVTSRWSSVACSTCSSAGRCWSRRRWPRCRNHPRALGRAPSI